MRHLLHTSQIFLVVLGDIKTKQWKWGNMWYIAEIPYLAPYVSSGDEEVIREDGLAEDEREEGREYGMMKRRGRMWHELIRDMN